MSVPEEPTLRQQIEAVFVQLREAVAMALGRHTIVASKLDESRSELEVLLMLDDIDEPEAQRALGRAQLLLDLCRGMAVVPVRSR
jgi:hypothetical protein